MKISSVVERHGDLFTRRSDIQVGDVWGVGGRGSEQKEGTKDRKEDNWKNMENIFLGQIYK